jgi:hypothetical protein
MDGALFSISLVSEAKMPFEGRSASFSWAVNDYREQWV